MLLDALPGDSLYKTAVRDSIDDDDLVRLAAAPTVGHGRWSHTDLLLADIIDRLGHLGYALRAYEKPPEAYRRPGIVARRRRQTNDAVKAMVRAIALEHAELHGYSLDE